MPGARFQYGLVVASASCRQAQDTRLQNAVMKRFWEIFKTQGEKDDSQFWSTQWIQHIYAEEITAPDSPLRHLAVDFVLYEVYTEWPATHPEQFPHQTLIELSSRISLEPLKKEPSGKMFTHTWVERNYFVAEDGA
jgi:hypothetical protein